LDSVGTATGAMVSSVGLTILLDVDSNGSAKVVASTRFSPPTAADSMHNVDTIATAIVRDQTGAIPGCGDRTFVMRARRPDTVNIAGAARMARVLLLRLASLIRHSAYDFGEPVIATLISSQAISRSTCRRRSTHQTAGCHPATVRTTICRT
jgi:hypothetical protein